MAKILFFNNKQKKCGINQIGARIGRILDKYSQHEIAYREVGSMSHAKMHVETEKPDIILINHFDITIGWLNDIGQSTKLPVIATVHDNIHNWVQLSKWFNKLIVHDPTFPNIQGVPNLVRAVRPIEEVEGLDTAQDNLTFGSHGFGISNWKRFDTTLHVIGQEFGAGATVRFNIGFADFGDSAGQVASQKAAECQSVAQKYGFKLEITHEFFAEEQDLVRWLSKNYVNIYFLEGSPHNGPAGSLDLAVAAKRGVIINDTHMYRHAKDLMPYFPETPFRTLYNSAKYNSNRLYDEWCPKKMSNQYDAVINEVLSV